MDQPEVVEIGDHAFELSADEGVPFCAAHRSFDCAGYLDDDEAAALEDAATE